jgi:glutamate/aspartate transport system substrate-binding protein
MAFIAVGRKVEMVFRNMRVSGFSSAVRACCLVFALLLSCSSNAVGTLEKISQSGTIALGYRISLMPFSYLDANQRPIGYSIDVCMKIVDAVRRHIGRPDVTVNFSSGTTSTGKGLLLGGETDLECGSSALNEQRLTQIAFSIPIFISTLRMVVREGSGIRSISNLAGKKVVTTKGTSSEKEFQELNQLRSLGADLVLAKNNVESFSMLESGYVDALVMDDVLVYSLRSASKEPDKFHVLRDSLSQKAIALMMRNDDPAFKTFVDAEVTRMIISGEMKAIYHKWFESPIPPNQLNIGLPLSYMMKEHFKAPKEWKIYSATPQ